MTISPGNAFKLMVDNSHPRDPDMAEQRRGHFDHMNSRILGSSIVVATREQVSCDLAGEAAILDIKSGIYYGLNAVGARIWNLIQTPKTVDEVGKTILQEYDVEAEHCHADILALLEELVAKGLVEICHETDL